MIPWCSWEQHLDDDDVIRKEEKSILRHTRTQLYAEDETGGKALRVLHFRYTFLSQTFLEYYTPPAWLKILPPSLSSKFPLLHRPQPHIRNKGKTKRQGEPHVPSIQRVPNVFPNRPNEPHLRHAHDGTENTETECQNGCDPGGEEMRGGVVGHVVALDAAPEDEVFCERDAFIDGEPVALGKC